MQKKRKAPPGAFKPGHDPRRANGGRPKGSRDALGRAFIEALHADFMENGEGAIAAARAESPLGYVRVVASVLPKQLNITRATDELSDQQLAGLIAAVDAHIGSDADLSAALGRGIGAAAIGEPASKLPAIH